MSSVDISLTEEYRDGMSEYDPQRPWAHLDDESTPEPIKEDKPHKEYPKWVYPVAVILSWVVGLWLWSLFATADETTPPDTTCEQVIREC